MIGGSRSSKPFRVAGSSTMTPSPPKTVVGTPSMRNRTPSMCSKRVRVKTTWAMRARIERRTPAGDELGGQIDGRDPVGDLQVRAGGFPRGWRSRHGRVALVPTREWPLQQPLHAPGGADRSVVPRGWRPVQAAGTNGARQRCGWLSAFHQHVHRQLARHGRSRLDQGGRGGRSPSAEDDQQRVAPPVDDLDTRAKRLDDEIGAAVVADIGDRRLPGAPVPVAPACAPGGPARRRSPSPARAVSSSTSRVSRTWLPIELATPWRRTGGRLRIRMKVSR